MNDLELLRALFRSSTPRTTSQALPSDELRFVLEHDTPPDVGAVRARLVALLGLDTFELRPLFALSAADPNLGRFLSLSAPGTERAMPPHRMFALAHWIREQLQLRSVEPDLGVPIFVDPEPPRMVSRREAADTLGATCWVSSSDPPGFSWALDNIRARDAWAVSPVKGLGTLIGHIDTGIAAHEELAPTSLRLDLAADILDGDADPTDPLDPKDANPGHGTATASVAIGGESGNIAGAAPRAKIVPIRCIRDVKVFDAAPVAAAIDHARTTGCHVLTMSLGGVPSRALRAAIRRAVEDHRIVVAAAGNCVRTVVWPARYPEVIAVAGTNVLDAAWRGSCRGDAVAVSAPAELVWRAHRQRPTDPLDGVSAGQGTSFAVALVAGVAALWMSHHGHDRVVAEATSRGITVQRLFRRALKATARRPANWSDSFGAGIVNARAILDLPLDAIPGGNIESAVRLDDSGVLDLAAELSGDHSPAAAPSVDLAAYGLEIAHLLLSDARAGRGRPGTTREARSFEGATPQLRSAAAASNDSRLSEFVNRRPIPASRSLRIDSIPPSDILILARATNGLESTEALTPERARAMLTPAAIRNGMDRTEAAFARLHRDDDDEETLALRARVIDRGEAAMQEMVRDTRSNAELRVVREALVALHGRPALRVERRLDPGAANPNAEPIEQVDLEGPEVEPWRDAIQLIGGAELGDRLRSVGRIDMDGEHVGTGFVVGDGLVMTNRHVAEVIATPVPRRRNPTHWILNSDDVTIDFHPDPDGGSDRSTAFRVRKVTFAGADPIEDFVDFAHLDLALLEVETVSMTGAGVTSKFPPIATLASSAALAKRGSRAFVVGYPARPLVPSGDFEGAKNLEVVEQLRKIFGVRYGRKYFSPGLVQLAMGSAPGDVRKWVLSHDATTLAGNSGSPMYYLGDPLAVVGLHFAGDWMRANHAHAVAALRHVVPELGGLRWS